MSSKQLTTVKHEKSCGCIIIKGNTVLIENQKHKAERFWGFPKGHQNPGETDIETALRETREEVGLDVKITDKKPFVMNYYVAGCNVDKTVVLFLAKPIDLRARLTLQDEEVAEARWVSFDKAEELLTFDHAKAVWREALARIQKKPGTK